MHVKVRTMDGKSEALFPVSKLTKVEELKSSIAKKLNVSMDLQRLFFRGKQLENGYKLYDYNINLTDVIQLMIKTQIDTLPIKATCSRIDDTAAEQSAEEEPVLEDSESLYYKVGDAVDCLDSTHGAWFEGIILQIGTKVNKLMYKVKWEFDDKAMPFIVPESSLRPRSWRQIIPHELQIDQTVLINYNLDEPGETGIWYDFKIAKINLKRKLSQLIGTLYIGRNNQLENCVIDLKTEVYAIEESKLLANRTEEDEKLMISTKKRRRVAAYCKKCSDDPLKNCKECGCKVCGGKEDEHNLLLCDECNLAYHLKCLDPPLASVPEDDYWYCPGCKNDENEIVKAGDKLKTSKKKPVTHDDTKRDWGKGMACVGKTKDCTLVPTNHKGPIPGVEVGTIWIYRVQVSEAGIHRPPVGGIHGRENDCAYSLVLSGGYEDDIDNGDEFIYTGSGGRDLSGNKRTAEQSCDQTLTKMNKALALNCNAKFNDVDGAIAKDWKGGKPVRVVRSSKLAKHSKYAPKQGNRYDGLYKVVKYYPATGKSGFRIWRYVLRRDDNSPAPWTPEGKARIEALGLQPIFPEGYQEAKENTEERIDEKVSLAPSVSSKRQSPSAFFQAKKQKPETYELDKTILKYIEDDYKNKKLWNECQEFLSKGKIKFLSQVKEGFTCVCCLELVHKPITTPCGHNICHRCLKDGFLANVTSCPTCRHPLGKDYKFHVNESLCSALLQLYPGYEVGRK